MIGTVMSHGSAAPSSSTESVMLPSFPRFGPETPDPQNGNEKRLHIESTRSIYSTKSTRSDGKVYPFDCPSYNPLVAVAATVEHILHRRLSYRENVKDIHYFQVKDGQGSMFPFVESSLLLWKVVGMDKADDNRRTSYQYIGYLG